MLGFFRITNNAFPSKRFHPEDAGYDLYSAYEDTVPARGRKLVKTDIAVQLPAGSYGRIAARSGLALNHSIYVGGGVIDANYSGNICVILINHSDKAFMVKRGDRIAQLICKKICFPSLHELSIRKESACGENARGN